MNPATLAALEAFPAQLERHYAAFPVEFIHWTPESWDGVPSERFTALEQICHVRDIEIEGYHERVRRTLEEDEPFLAAIDSEAVALQRNYGAATASEVFLQFRAARATTLQMLAGLTRSQLERRAEFEGYGSVSLRGLVHFLCSHDQQHLAGLQWLLGKVSAPR